MMTQAAQSALRRGESPFLRSHFLDINRRILLNDLVIETHTKNVRFCILCNYVNKITPAIQSRCTRFRFSPLPEKEIQRKVDEVVEREGYVYPCNSSHDIRYALKRCSSLDPQGKSDGRWKSGAAKAFKRRHEKSFERVTG